MLPNREPEYDREAFATSFMLVMGIIIACLFVWGWVL